MDDFEKNIKEQRALFDEYKADRSKLWKNIEAGLEQTKNSSKVMRLWQSRMFKVAATIVIVLGISGMIHIMSSAVTGRQSRVLNRELTAIDMHYNGLVARQIKLINSNTRLSPQEKKEFLSFMDELDEEYEMLKRELYKNLDSERVLEAIVINYKKRIELIENLLKQINSSKEMNNEHEYIL
ncbi:hypothetical protein MQE36_01460 [Zhouia spongiae]|uniref:Anti-sigma factor n=1 Tax=Zhouia spongiae TaxID=2202721 RepID=A0ABY3YMH5_9FLAO|nr:hypothetical protein [Zhouia spongiae]UNY99031.1 hypothetical protein MQE36_01460 [Zhouia spongiae]